MEETRYNQPSMTKLKRFLPGITYACIALFLGLYVSRLGLMLDDNVHIFPALLGDFMQHFQGYTYDYGLMRPLGLILFYIIYPLFLFSPALSHLLVFAFHLLTGYLIFRICLKYFGKTEGMLFSLLYLTFPFFTEQYGWLAASNATLANLVLIGQLLLVVRQKLSFRWKILILLLLQAIAVMLYESTFFTFLPLIVLLLKLQPVRISKIKTTVLILISATPSLLYIAVRDFVFPPHHGFALRELTVTEVVNGSWIQIMLANLVKFFDSMRFLFHPHIMQIFWIQNFISGLLTLSNPFLLLSFLLVTAAIVAFLFMERTKDIHSSFPKDMAKTAIWLCLALSFFSLLPSMLLQAPTFPFRVLALPVYFLLAALLLAIRLYSRRVFIILSLIVSVYGIFASAFIIQSMSLQAQKDAEAFTQIVTTIDQHVPKGHKTTLVIEKGPHSNLTPLTYGEYLGTCVSTDWCLQAAMNRRTDKVVKVIVNPEASTIPQENTTIFVYNPQINAFSYKKSQE